MYRDFFMNRWAIGCIAFLIIFSAACIFWYQYDTAKDRKVLTDAQEYVQRLENNHKSNANKVIYSENNPMADESTLTAEKHLTNTSSVLVPGTTSIQSKSKTKSASTDIEKADSFISPFGFGPYPKVPVDYFSKPIWIHDPSNINDFPDHALMNIELIDRVLVKLWVQGDHAIIGGSTHNGKVYPHYPDVVYVGYKEKVTENGETYRFISSIKSSPLIRLDPVKALEGDIPPHYRIVDLEKAGIDPYEFLNLDEPEY